MSFAVDLASGKMLWRSGVVPQPGAGHDAGPVPDARHERGSRSSRRRATSGAWAATSRTRTSRPSSAWSAGGRRAAMSIWQSSDLPDYARDGPRRAADPGRREPCSSRASRRTRRTAAGQPAAPIRPGDPAARRQAALEDGGRDLPRRASGTTRTTDRSDTTPQPRLIYRAGSIYVDTHIGVLARLDAESGDVDWGYGYQTDPVQSQSRFFFF